MTHYFSLFTLESPGSLSDWQPSVSPSRWEGLSRAHMTATPAIARAVDSAMNTLSHVPIGHYGTTRPPEPIPQCVIYIRTCMYAGRSGCLHPPMYRYMCVERSGCGVVGERSGCALS